MVLTKLQMIDILYHPFLSPRIFNASYNECSTLLVPAGSYTREVYSDKKVLVTISRIIIKEKFKHFAYDKGKGDGNKTYFAGCSQRRF